MPLAPRVSFFISLIALSFLLLAMRVSAQEAPPNQPEATDLISTFTYQGYLEQAAVPVTATCDFQFSLFDSLTAGAQIGSTLTRSAVAVSGGVFTVPLDFGAAAFNGQDRFLALSARCPAGVGAFTALSPRQPITPAPYSTFAVRTPWTNILGIPAGFLDGVDDTGADWSLAGNAGTTTGTNFIGTTDNQPLEFRVNNTGVMRYIATGDTPNIVGGLSGNSVTSGVIGATIGGGGSSLFGSNRVTDNFGTVAGGQNNQAGDGAGAPGDRTFATVSGGANNTASRIAATVAGGSSNTASGTSATVGGGATNIASGSSATVGGGLSNIASGAGATVPGGALNTASSDFSFAAGRNANANDLGAFAWADATGGEFNSLGDHTFNVRASGGTFFISNAAGNTGVFLAPGGGAWASLSDQAMKENVEAIDPAAVLDALVSIPVSTWNYIAQDDTIRHMGVMAQDFYAAFGIGEDERHITTIDADGVAFAAIQGLNQKLEAENAALHAENAAMNSRIDTLEDSNSALEARLAQIEALASGGQSASLLPLALLGGAGLLVLALRRM